MESTTKSLCVHRGLASVFRPRKLEGHLDGIEARIDELTEHRHIAHRPKDADQGPELSAQMIALRQHQTRLDRARDQIAPAQCTGEVIVVGNPLKREADGLAVARSEEHTS